MINDGIRQNIILDVFYCFLGVFAVIIFRSPDQPFS